MRLLFDVHPLLPQAQANERGSGASCVKDELDHAAKVEHQRENFTDGKVITNDCVEHGAKERIGVSYTLRESGVVLRGRWDVGWQ